MLYDIDKRAEKAKEYFMQGYNCSQSVAMAFADVVGSRPEEVAAITSGFGGGFGRMREVCGCVSGMTLIAGAACPSTNPSNKAERTRNYALVQQLAADFKALQGSIVCRDLLGIRTASTTGNPVASLIAGITGNPVASNIEGTTGNPAVSVIESPEPSDRTPQYYHSRGCADFVACAAAILAANLNNLEAERVPAKFNAERARDSKREIENVHNMIPLEDTRDTSDTRDTKDTKDTKDAKDAKDVNEIRCGNDPKYRTLDFINWPGEFPYKPDVQFAVSADNDSLLIHFKVKEDVSAAAAGQDGGRVWEDSCVEFFCAFDDTGYYNIECNCIGKLVFAFGPGRNGRTPAPYEKFRNIGRWSSAGSVPFEEKRLDGWEVALAIPYSSFFNHKITKQDMQKARINIYKCGDKLSKPHFVSLFPIDTPSPDFHRPEFFRQLF